MKTELSEIIDQQKYREKGESHNDKVNRLAGALADNEEHRLRLKDIFSDQRFLPAGRIQNAVGSARITTPFNCYVSGTILDDFDDIMDKNKEAGQTMRKGGGIGYDFSTLRPRGDKIRSLDSTSSGPVSFMKIFDATCRTILSAGHRRGAQMGVLRVDHPDIEEFVTAKHDRETLTNFNVSIGITDKFMDAVREGSPFELVFNGEVYKTIDARNLWDKIMRSTWDWAEPGVLFIDTINKKNNLWYCETIAATNPCGEQPLPPYGACLLGSQNLTAYLVKDPASTYGVSFDKIRFERDIYDIVRAVDNVIDGAIFPLEAQRQEAMDKRRMGLGVTGLANTLEILRMPYGSPEAEEWTEKMFRTLRDTAYRASIEVAKEKGPFPKFDVDLYLQGNFIKDLPEDIVEEIKVHGIRNSHLLSIAPTGTISLVAGNVSSGIEPPFSLEYERDVFLEDGEKRTFQVKDYAWNFFNIRGKTADDLTPEEHVRMLNIASKYVDSSCSKTCNVGDDVSFERFKNIYMMAWEGGASGCTTFRAAGKRFGVLRKTEVVDSSVLEEGAACFIDPVTGDKECG